MADSVPGNVSSTVDTGVGTALIGTIETTGDHDWYRLTLTAGQRYSFATSFGAGANFDTEIVLRDASGTSIVSDDDSGPGAYSLINYTATRTGIYFLDVGAFNNATIGSFTLAVSSAAPPPGDVVAGDATTTSSITLGGNVTGRIDAIGDHDWYRVTFVAGQTYQINTVATGGSGDPDTTISVRDASGNELSFNDDGPVGTYSSLRFTASTTGSYYIDVATYGEAETGAFTLTLAEAAPLTAWTNDQIAFQLTNTYWGGNSRHFDVASGGTLSVNVTGLTTEGLTLARAALSLWRDSTGINFSEVASGGQIVVDDNEGGAFTSATTSAGIITSARVNIGIDWLSNYGTSLTGYAFQSYVHEVGHALGLGHAGDYNETAAYPADASYLNDNWSGSIMSYFSQSENGYVRNLGYTRQFQLTPTAADDIAVSNLYGAVTTTRTGDTRYGYGSTAGSAVFDAAVNRAGGYVIVDNGGIDTLDYSGWSGAQVINLAPEGISNVTGGVGNVSIARGTIVEVALGGAGSDAITGNLAANTLNGGGGSDTLSGLGGDDVYIVDSAGDVVVEGADGGKDVVFAIGNYTLPAQAQVETLSTISNAATTGATLIGNGFAQTIIGDFGNNTIGDGGLVSGPGDVLVGLRGDDVYVVNSARVFVIENANEGNDTVIVTALGSNFVLNANTSVETLVAQTGTDAINITGSPTAERILGNDGANILSTGGVLGDTLQGGLGDDTYRVFGGLDTIVEAAGQGNDSVFVSGNSFMLNAGAAVEYISVASHADTGAFYLVGNEVGQIVVGNYGDNILDGNAGASGNADVLIGLFGNDTYRVYQQGDTIQEAAGQGSDGVFTSASYQLRNGVSVETLSAASHVATDLGSQYVLRGNEVAQTLIGNDAANTLDGRGGSDVLIGRGGGDVFAFTTAPGDGNVDVIQDFAGGSDRIGLASDVFAAVTADGLLTGEFVLGTTALDGDDRLLYDQATGRLFYDADASGAGAAALFAQLAAGTMLGIADFVIVAPVGDLTA